MAALTKVRLFQTALSVYAIFGSHLEDTLPSNPRQIDRAPSTASVPRFRNGAEDDAQNRAFTGLDSISTVASSNSQRRLTIDRPMPSPRS
jgi:hypothetical protein